MAIPQLVRTLSPIMLLFAVDSLRSVLPVSGLVTVAVLTGIAVAGAVMAWRRSFGVTERTLWGLVAGWLMVNMLAMAVIWQWRGPLDTVQATVVWRLWLEGATIAVALVFALYASHRVAYGGWFIIGLYIARLAAQTTASPGINMPDIAFRLYVPLALLAYVLVLGWAAVIASTFDQQPYGVRRLWSASLVGLALLVIVSEVLFFRHVAEFAEAAWWWAMYDYHALPASMSKAVDFFAWGVGTMVVYALLRLGWPGTHQELAPGLDDLQQAKPLSG